MRQNSESLRNNSYCINIRKNWKRNYVIEVAKGDNQDKSVSVLVHLSYHRYHDDANKKKNKKDNKALQVNV